jgi:hypothetical protein
MNHLEKVHSLGPIGKLHNLIRYINHLPQRQDAFLELQIPTPYAVGACGQSLDIQSRQLLHSIQDNVTRWNSWCDAIERAIGLRPYIDEFTDDELADYRAKLARREAPSKVVHKDPPKAPSTFEDKLTPDD